MSKTFSLRVWQLLAGALLFAAMQICASAQTATSFTGPCPRFPAGILVPEPSNLYSQAGKLTVNLTYNTTTDSAGRTLYCFTTSTGIESPTLHVKPGDTLTVNVKNNLPAPTSAAAMAPTTNATLLCGAATQDASSVNVHYHGTNTSPTCHSDEVIHTLINSGQSFTYNIVFPVDEPPGLYWYHPHVHGLAETAVQGGASGVIVVEGIQNVQPAVAGLPERILIIRDQVLPANSPPPGGAVPAWDLSVNYVPILYPKFQPAQLVMRPGEKQFWRVSNSSADTILDLQLRYDGVPQTLQIVGLDGVPTGSQDGTALGKLVPVTHIRMPPASRAEFIVTGPSTAVNNATLFTLSIDTGPDGDNDPQRPLINIRADNNAAEPTLSEGPVSAAPGPQRFAGLATATVNRTRVLYFSEDNPNSQFFITVDGQTPVLFSPNNPPAITTTQGSVEDWIIQNRTLENHEFHMHQIHFLLMERNGVPVSAAEQQFLDMVDVPYGSGAPPYPSVKVRMDFRGPDIGDFVYHCHILEHEDDGMMAIIRVLPAANADDKTGATPSARQPDPQPAALRKNSGAGPNY
ncbi:MAG TPA: multicopper oxidase domain-containing protein [Bryobacteraceae bacterium]|nr:multicopper oxidase domain-containing protein [Bryobacteraceae bacterium]